MAESNPNEVLLRVAQALEEQNTRAKTKQKEKDKFKPGKLVGALAKNSAAVLGLSQGLTSIKGFFAQAVKDNQQVTKQLSLFTAASTQTSREMVGSLNTGFNRKSCYSGGVD
jgi:3-methyladenine DNA glycosylase Tag